MKNNLLALSAALAGGIVGHAVFLWLTTQGLYGLIIPGGFLGLAAGMFATRSLGVAIACGVMALVIGLYSEWKFAPFTANESLGYFFSHMHQLRPLTLIMILAGTAIGFWVPFRRIKEAGRQ